MIRKKTLIILSVIIIVIIGLAIALMLANENFLNPNSKDSKTEITGDINQPEFNTNQLPEEIPVKPEPVITETEQFLTTVARNFAERFGSYSTDSNNVNLEEVKLLSSAKLIKQLENMIQNGSNNSEYYGVSSKVLKITINNLDENSGEALVTVKMQREETNTQQNKLVFYQDLELSIISSGNEWLVNNFEWQQLD